MKAVVQRVAHASVVVEGETVGEISRGILLFLGIDETDGEQDLDFLVRKIVNARIFPDSQGKMNRSVQDTAGELLLISQFTLCADTNKGNRPSFNSAAGPETAIPLYESAKTKFSRSVRVASGIFGADMQVTSLNDGPVTILYDSKRAYKEK